MINISVNLRKIAVMLAKKDMNEDVFKFLKENKNPSGVAVHAFAEKKNYDTDEVEKALYELATMFVRFKTEGYATEKKFAEKDADPKQVKMGIKVEREHIKDDDTAKKIVLDHLAEIPNYYNLLEEMERGAKK